MSSGRRTEPRLDEAHAVFVAALRARDYERRVIKRSRERCYLVVVRAGDGHVFVDHLGIQLIRRHAWQIREWLHRDFGIRHEDVAVERLR